jgi:type III restriction enzyme
MQLKEYQQRVLRETALYLEQLADWKKKAEENPSLEIDFPSKAWEKASIPRPYISRKNGLGQPLPTFCFKIPTGGGKTLLAVKTVDLVTSIYLRRKTGLVLWIVPTTQIYRQTISSLKNKDHPYRQHLDLASGGRTIILEKSDHFSRADVQQNLVVLMLMLPSANRKTKETLKIFQDSGGFHTFFPDEDDVKAQEALLLLFPNLDTYQTENGFWGRQIKTSLGNPLRLLSPLIVLDEGHKAYSEGAQSTLRGFNPCLILELSATPPPTSVLVDVTGRDLHREEMIKLDLHVVNKASPDWRDTLLAAVDKRISIEARARELHANTGTTIRPICLIQVERTGREQIGRRWIHSEQVREHLTRVLNIPPDQIAVKTSEKDELREVDDTGGLLSPDCPIRFIITRQALQEGWDCAFAYVLVILANPSSKNALTQLVGRILRQPYARKTHIRELDESFVFCFQQRAERLLESIRAGFSQEGLGDLRSLISTDAPPTDQSTMAGMRHLVPRDRFRKAADRTLLPVFVVRSGDSWRPVNYDMDIASKIPWGEVDLAPVLTLALSDHEKKDVEFGVSLTDNPQDLIEPGHTRAVRQPGLHVNPVFMTRQLCDIVPNPWQAHEFSTRVLAHFRRSSHNRQRSERILADNFVFIIEELRRQLASEKDRLAEGIFRGMLKKDKLRFLVIGNNMDWKPPRSIDVTPLSRTITRKDGSPLQLSLFEFVPETDLNETEKAVAWYLENQARLFFWYRNRARHDYSLQAWRPHRIYPDFILATAQAQEPRTYDRVFVVETKGLHLKDNDRTDYIRKVFRICTERAQSRDWAELSRQMKDKTLRFEVLAEDEWQAKLNELLQQ